MANETRAELLKELAGFVRPTTLAEYERLGTDEEIRQYIAAAKEQRASHAAIEERRQARS